MKRFGLDPPEGFRGLDWNREIRRYRRNLPHWRQNGATYFVTFRLADSLPREALEKLAEKRREWEKKFATKPATDEPSMEFTRQLAAEEERWLDHGSGECLLKHPKASKTVETRLRKFDGERYQLGAFVIMPNHVHLAVRPFDGFELDGITKGWKGVSAREINHLMARKTAARHTMWQDESHDTIIRDESHLFRVVQYIGNNPAKAKLTGGFVRWVCADWSEMGYGFQDS